MKVFIKNIICPQIEAGESYQLQYNGKILSESILQKMLPVLSVSVLNLSAEMIRVYINDTTDNAFIVAPNQSRSISGIPFNSLHVKNEGAAAITADSISCTIVNDISNIKLYEEAKSKGWTVL